jgi:hypothetical protein
MGVNGGAGNTISFSEIQAFYGGSGEISISEYARGGDNVPSSITGASTATSSSGAATKNDFGITQSTGTQFTGTLGSSVIRQNMASGNYTVTADDAVISLVGSHPSGASDENVSHTWTITRSGSVVFGPQALSAAGAESSSLYIGGTGSSSYSASLKGPVYNSAGISPLFSTSFTAQAGDIISVTNFNGNAFTSTRRRSGVTIYDITFTNNNSTGDTYTLASSSTGHSTKSVYAAGDSQKVLDDSTSNSWTIAYDNVTGAGAGTAGDISVSAPFYTGSAANTMSDSNIVLRDSVQLGSGNDGVSMSLSYTVLASDAQFFISGGGVDNVGGGETQASAGWNASGALSLSNQGAGLTFRGPAYNNKLGFSGALSSSFPSGTISSTGTLTLTTTAGTAGGSLLIYSARRNGAITFTNNNSGTAYALGSSSTGGAGNIAASGTRSVNTGTISTNPSWAVHFDTSTGNCNTNIPATIGSGNPVNLDLFNAPGTPVG